MKTRAKFLSAAAALLACLTGLLVTSSSASALTNVYQIHARLGSSCLDADANHAGAGGAVNIVTCNSNNAQKWQFGTLGGYPVMINVGHPGYALAAGSLTVGSAMTLKAASGTDHTEFFQDDPTYSTNGIIYAVFGHLVLQPNSSASGQRVYLRTYEGITGLQSWNVVRLS